MINWNDIWLIFLGSFLTFIATVLVEWIKNNVNKSERSKNFKLIIKQEFTSIKKTLEKLKTVLEYKYYYDYKILEELVKSLNNLEVLKKDAINLSNQLTQEKFLDLLSDLSSWITNVKILQDSYYEEEKKIKEDLKLNKKSKTPKLSSFKDMESLINFFNINSVQKLTDLIELKRRLDEFIKSF